MNYLYKVNQRVRIVGNTTIQHYAPLGQVAKNKKSHVVGQQGSICCVLQNNKRYANAAYYTRRFTSRGCKGGMT